MATTAVTPAGRQTSRRSSAVTPRPVRATPAAGATRSSAARTAPAAGATRSSAARTAPAAGATRSSAARTTSPHRRGVSRSATPKAPRRVSGPIVMRGGEIALPLPGFQPPALPRPRRKPAPGRSPVPKRAPVRDRTSERRPGVAGRSLARRTLGAVVALPDLPLLDRIVRGRTWIALLGAMLVGIVTMQVEMLKLGRQIGVATSQATVLESRNELLRASVAGLSNVQRIEQLAVQKGLVMPPPTGVGFVSGASYQSQIARALANIHAPSASTFGTQHATNGGVTVAAGETTAVAPSTGG